MDTARRARLARRRVVASLAAVCVAAALLVAVLVGTALRASLPLLTGERRVAGLGVSVRIERDGLGIPTITAADRVDASFALGFLHAQDRFFQMDVLRRSAAGELAALFGRAALGVDRAVRVHRFRARARQLAATMPGAESVALFDRMTELMIDRGEVYDLLVFDTAPTGHTLRLLRRRSCWCPGSPR